LGVGEDRGRLARLVVGAEGGLMETRADVIVVGSGASAVHAAYPLVQAGRRVIMLDVGREDETYDPLIPPLSFSQIRRTDPQQHRYFLGDDFEGVPLGQLGAGPQVTPPRQYVLKDSDSIASKQAGEFAALESFALGGLGQAWGAGAFPFLDGELIRCGLPVKELREHYEIVSRRIGITGDRDDLLALRGPLYSLQPPLELDHNASAILGRYTSRRDKFLRQGAALGRTVLAVLTRPLGNRGANPYRDMEFWTNPDGCVYRPSLTVTDLRSYTNFHYYRPFFVEEFFEPADGGVTVQARNLTGEGRVSFTGNRLILAAGALGTTRIVLRSLHQYDVPVPFVCNPHSYIPSLHLASLGKPAAERCTSLAQLTLIYDPTGTREHLVQSQMFSYRSLMLFRLLKESPLAYREGLRVMQALQSAFVIWVVQYEDAPTRDKTCVLRRGERGGADLLEVNYRLTAAEEQRCREQERAIVRLCRQLGCWPLKTVHPEHGASIHYGGQLPFCAEEEPLTTETETGRLRGTRAVHVADGAAFVYLPAKGLTLTLMANANRIGASLLA
jgi:hypothetical protein